MMKYLPVLLCVLLLLIIGAVVFMLLRRRTARPAANERALPPAAGQPRHERIADGQQSRQALDLQQKLLHDYQRPGGLRSQCLSFLLTSEEEEALCDVEALRVHVVNTCLYPLHIAVMRYDDLFSALPKSPLLQDLVAVFNSDTILRLIQGQYADLSEGLHLISALRAEVEVLTARHPAVRRSTGTEAN